MSRNRPPRTPIGELRPGGEPVRVCGWVAEVLQSGDPWRMTVRDRSGVAVVSGSAATGSAQPVAGLAPESAVEVIGVVDGAATAGPPRPHVSAQRLEVLSTAATPLPISDASPLSERMDWRYLDLRRPRNRLIFAVQTTAERAMRQLWHEQGFIELHSPKLRPLPNKSGGELFAVEYFGRRVYLAQSPQWYKQMAMAAGFDRVFEIGPVFRPQREPTSRHDTEFTSVDIEISWIDSDDDVMAAAEQLMVRTLEAVRAEHGEDIRRHFGVEVPVPATPFPRVPFNAARALVAGAGGSVTDDDEDLDPAGERLLAEHVVRQHGHELVFVTEYPQPSRPYYHMLRSEGSPATRSFDLLYKGLEIASGAQREHRYDRLVAQARSRGVDVERVSQYLEFFKFGCPPHGGFGLGLTRMLVSLLDAGDVREVTFLFRGPDRIAP